VPKTSVHGVLWQWTVQDYDFDDGNIQKFRKYRQVFEKNV